MALLLLLLVRPDGHKCRIAGPTRWGGEMGEGHCGAPTSDVLNSHAASMNLCHANLISSPSPTQATLSTHCPSAIIHQHIIATWLKRGVQG